MSYRIGIASFKRGERSRNDCAEAATIDSLQPEYPFNRAMKMFEHDPAGEKPSDF